jgi:mannosyltransferase OCH1-like enzyme
MENSFTSLLYAINLLFSYVFKTKNNISYIESQDTTFYLCTGEKITSIIVGNKVTPVLISDVKKFNRNFEQRYKIELEQDNTTLAQLDIPKNYFEKHFPYLVIRQKMVKNNLEIE